MPEVAPAKVHATQVTFELHSLGWKAFQQLCVSIVSEIWGQHVQAFYDSKDGGRDGAFRGAWKTATGDALEGNFTVQCKFTSRPDTTLKLANLADDLKKATRLASRGLADNYFLFTNARLTGASEEGIRTAFEKIPGIKHFAAYGSDRISHFIQESARLRMLVPRVYGLGDLSKILDQRAYAQSAEILSALGDDLRKFVITDAYQRSAKALVEHGFVLLLGEPACGKSTIAAALSLGALDEWGCSTLKIRDADDFVRHSNPNEPKQFFWVDDAFGATQLDWQGTIAWNRTFPHVQAAIRRGAKVIFTSRDYIYRATKQFLKQSALPVIQESQVVVRVEQLGKEEKEQILYNHVRLGTQPTKFKSALKPFLLTVSAHDRFSPETARRLGNQVFTKALVISESGLNDFVARPMELLKEVIQTIDVNSRSAIALVFMRGGSLPSPVSLTSEETEAVRLLGGSESEVRNALVAMDGSLLIQVQQEGSFAWRLKHPTIRDAFAALIAENRELMDIYLAGTPLLQLFREVSCGDSVIEGVKVVVPGDRYDSLLRRIEAFLANSRESKDVVNRFLADRCDREFLSRFVARNPSFVPSLRVGSYLIFVSAVDVIVRLREVGLLPEVDRLRHVAEIRKLAIDTPDAGFLSEDIRPLFNEAEFEDILGHVRDQLLPRLSKCVDEWQDNHDGTEDPESYFDSLSSALKDYRETLVNDSVAVDLIDAGLAKVEEAIKELYSKLPAEPESEERFDDISHGPAATETRSIFDDVDQ